MKLIFLFGGLTIILALSTMFLAGCDGGLSVTGVAFEWTNAPPDATSKIYITNVKTGEDVEQALKDILDNIPKGITKVPLENAEITIAEPNYPNSYIVKTISNSIGEFVGNQTVSPYKFQIRVKAFLK